MKNTKKSKPNPAPWMLPFAKNMIGIAMLEDKDRAAKKKVVWVKQLASSLSSFYFICVVCLCVCFIIFCFLQKQNKTKKKEKKTMTPDKKIDDAGANKNGPSKNKFQYDSSVVHPNIIRVTVKQNPNAHAAIAVNT